MIGRLSQSQEWIHKLKPFPLDNPMAKIELLSVGTGLEIERTITPAECRRTLDAADSLPGLVDDSRADIATAVKSGPKERVIDLTGTGP